MKIDLGTSGSSVGLGGVPTAQQKLHDSAHQFEAMLMTSVWKQERENQQDDDSEEDCSLGGSNNPLQDVAFQGIAGKAAEAGGFGIARMIERAMQSKLATGQPTSDTKLTSAAEIGASHAYTLAGAARFAAQD